MSEYYFEYKEGDNKYKGVVEAPTDHAADSMIKQQLQSVNWATQQGGEFVGIAMMTPAEQLDRDTDYYVQRQKSPYDNSDWEERLNRSQRMRENGDDIIEVDLDD